MNVASKRIQCDEIWSFVGSKEKNTSEENKELGHGDAWTRTAIDSRSKLIVSYLVGDRSADSAYTFMNDVASRLKNRVQFTSDGHKANLDAVENAFFGQVDYAQLVKMYSAPTGQSATERKYSPQECTDAKKVSQLGNPDK